MTTKLNRIKSALRESIDIASKATDGPWEFTSTGCPNGGVTCYRIMEPGDFASSAAEVSEEDGDFISHTRTMTPLACKALLTAIEGLEQTLIGIGNTDNHMSYENAFIVNSIGDLVEKALSSITSEWPDV